MSVIFPHLRSGFCEMATILKLIHGLGLMMKPLGVTVCSRGLPDRAGTSWSSQNAVSASGPAGPRVLCCITTPRESFFPELAWGAGPRKAGSYQTHQGQLSPLRGGQASGRPCLGSGDCYCTVGSCRVDRHGGVCMNMCRSALTTHPPDQQCSACGLRPLWGLDDPFTDIVSDIPHVRYLHYDLQCKYE